MREQLASRVELPHALYFSLFFEDISPTVTTLTYEQIYTSGPTLEEAVVTFLGEALSRYEALRNRAQHGC